MSEKEEQKKPWWKGDLTPLLQKIGIGTTVPTAYLMFFYFQLSILLGAGCTILESLRGIARQLRNPYFKKVLFEVADSLERGKSFSESLRIFPKVFPEIFCSLVFIGEQTGTIETVVKRFAESEERSMVTRRMIQKAMIYPAILLTLSVVVVCVLMVFVFPKFMKVINMPIHKMPLPTQIVIYTSNFLTSYGAILLTLAIVLFIGYKVANSRPAGRRIFDWIWLRIPFLNQVFIKGDSTLFCRTLAIMLRAGLPIVRAVSIVRHTVHNVYFRDSIIDLEERITRGEGFTKVLKTYPRFFSETMILLSDAGEKTGNMDEMLFKISDYTEDELKNAIEFATSMLEPIMVICVACVVGVICAAMFLPLFDLGKGMK